MVGEQSAMIEIKTTVDDTGIDAPRSVWSAMGRGLAQCCPACGASPLYKRYLKVHDRCPGCGEELHHQRADDAPPYVTILIVGHIVVPGILLLEQTYAPESWVHMVIWLPLIVILSLLILPRVKGALIGLQWALRMHGFGGPEPMPGEPGAGSRGHQ